MMLGKIAVCGEVGSKAKINEQIPEQIDFEQGSSINPTCAQNLIRKHLHVILLAIKQSKEITKPVNTPKV